MIWGVFGQFVSLKMTFVAHKLTLITLVFSFVVCVVFAVQLVAGECLLVREDIRALLAGEAGMTLLGMSRQFVLSQLNLLDRDSAFITCCYVVELFMVLIFLSLAVESDVNLDLKGSVEILRTEPAFVLNLPFVKLIDVLEILAPHGCLKVWANPALSIMETPHLSCVVV